MSEEKIGLWFWVYWVGLILFAYGLVTFITSIWSPEAMQTAGIYGLYGAPVIGILGAILAVVGYFKKKT